MKLLIRNFLFQRAKLFTLQISRDREAAHIPNGAYKGKNSHCCCTLCLDDDQFTIRNYHWRHCSREREPDRERERESGN